MTSTRRGRSSGVPAADLGPDHDPHTGFVFRHAEHARRTVPASRDEKSAVRRQREGGHTLGMLQGRHQGFLRSQIKDNYFGWARRVEEIGTTHSDPAGIRRHRDGSDALTEASKGWQFLRAIDVPEQGSAKLAGANQVLAVREESQAHDVACRAAQDSRDGGIAVIK